MWAETGIYIGIGLFVVFMLVGIFYIASLSEDKVDLKSSENKEACLNLGCPSATLAVGSKSLQKYYPCVCKANVNITSEDKICFNSEYKAKYQGYKRVEC